MLSIDNILMELKRQLEWRAPANGKPQGYIILSRVYTQHLIEHLEAEREVRQS